jgi:hypothetical protein
LRLNNFNIQKKEFHVKLFLTRISFPRTSASCVDYLSKEFAGLAPWQDIVVIVYPRGIAFGALEGTRLEVVTADNFEEGLRRVDVHFRELAAQAPGTGRRYMAYAKVDRSYLDDLRSGTVKPDSSDGENICKLLQAAA